MSYRTIARRRGIGKSTVQRIVEEELKALPNSNQFTHKYCNQFSKVLVVDGKYFNVKGKERGLVLLWGVDYVKHDFPFFLVAPSESYEAWKKYFFYFKLINHPYERIVCDEHRNIIMAAEDSFPGSKVQLCYNHIKENIRRNLEIRTDDTYRPFMKIVSELLSEKRSEDDFNNRLFYLYKHFGSDERVLSVLTSLEKKKRYLRAFEGVSDTPITSNIIEGFNSHLEARLFSLRKFEDEEHAKLWMNGYILKRRYTKFTSCKGRFEKYNGHMPLEQTVKKEAKLPLLFL